MWSAAKRRVRDAEKRDERLHFKFIAEYVECLHKDVYDNAEELFNNIKCLYPNVKDLTKTVEYMRKVMPAKPIPRYYASRKTKENIEGMSEMVLEIPLLQINTITSSPVRTASPPVPTTSSPVASPPVSTASPSVSTAWPPVPTVSSPVSTPSLPVPTASPPVPLSENVYQTLLEDLQKDPDLWRLLNDFPTSDLFPEDNDMDDIIPSPDLFTPLETELEAVFW